MNLSLEQTLASILQSLADFFGVTTQTIMENAPMWLAKYGWYVTIKDLGLTIFIGGFIGIALVGGLFFIFYIMLDADYKKMALSYVYNDSNTCNYYNNFYSNYYLYHRSRVCWN